MAADRSKPRRRFFRYSLRTLMIVVTLFCILMAITAKRAREQKLAVKAILELGGNVYYEHQVVRNGVSIRTSYPIGIRIPGLAPFNPPGPEWIRQLVGDEYFFRVDQINLSGRKVNAAGLAAISRLTDVTTLHLTNTRVTDAGMEHLKRLTLLRDLRLDSHQITDAGIEHLTRLTRLQKLRLNSRLITDAGLEHLKGLIELRWFHLSGTQITDAGLEHLKGLTNLETLDLGYAQVTDEGVKAFQQALPNCEVKYLIR